MKACALIRRIAKWGSISLLPLLVIVYVLSGWFRVTFVTWAGPYCQIKGGMFAFGYDRTPSKGNLGVQLNQLNEVTFDSWFYWLSDYPYWYSAVPFWFILLLDLVLIAILTWPVARILAREGLIPYRRTRRGIMRGSVIAAGLISVLWCTSMLGTLLWTNADGRSTGFRDGAFWSVTTEREEGWSSNKPKRTINTKVLGEYDLDLYSTIEPASIDTANEIAFRSKSLWEGGKDWRLRAPLWMPAVICLLIAGFARWQERLAARRPRGTNCYNCGYEVRGMTVGAKCPECGK